MHKPCNTERTVQAQMAGGGCIICDLLFAEAFGVAGWLSRQLSRNCQLEWQCREAMLCIWTYVRSHTSTKPLNSLQERFLFCFVLFSNSRISNAWKVPYLKVLVKISPFDFAMVAR